MSNKPLDYSKFDNIDVSNSEDEDINVEVFDEPQSVTIPAKNDIKNEKFKKIEEIKNEKFKKIEEIKNEKIKKWDENESINNLSINGGCIEKYIWGQTKDEIFISVFVPESTSAKDVKVTVTEDSISITSPDFNFNGDFSYRIIEPEDIESIDWSILRILENKKKILKIIFQKKNIQNFVTIWWKSAFKGDPETDVSKIVGRKNTSSAFEDNWKEAHKLFKERIGNREKIQIQSE
eukprot:GHVL01043214.1.p1 GENE.GHVL01043214.1~~GHVL01043214.1.p1  ORF type:complete len:235 (+),score=80.49 GHVL01043214.1:36-740(+)